MASVARLDGILRGSERGGRAESPLRSGAVVISMMDLRLGRSPRLGGVNAEHVRTLVTTDGDWPPLLVTRHEGLIIDGVHRYEAAKLLHWKTIPCVRLEMTPAEAFVEAVRLNAAHGLPLTLKDRRHAAQVILASHGDWSDRRIAELCAISHTTVAGLRAEDACPTGSSGRMDARQGKDGRLRPVDRVQTHDRIVRAIEAEPEASLRRLAKIAQSSPETVRLVKKRLASAASADRELPGDSTAMIGRCQERWLADSALQSTDTGLHFLTWFTRTAVDEQTIEWIDCIPLSRVYEIADEARRRSEVWDTFAAALESRTSRSIATQGSLGNRGDHGMHPSWLHHVAPKEHQKPEGIRVKS